MVGGTNSGVAITVETHTLLLTILLVDDFLTYLCLFSGWFDFDIHVEAFTMIPSGCLFLRGRWTFPLDVTEFDFLLTISPR